MADERVVKLREIIQRCRLCPRECRVDRTAAQVGACGIGERAVIASAGPHFGEEPVLVGRGGSGTIFLAGCNLDCVFCQNHGISHSTEGHAVTAAELAALACRIEAGGCCNINFVTPTHVAHAVAEAVLIARENGLRVPIVYNCGGYESVETLRLLEGIVDIYMPDFKWADAAAGEKYSGVRDYPAVAEAALAEMFRQVGTLDVEGGIARRGVLVRHLVMPNNLAGSRDVIDIVARAAPGCAINVMGQYRPEFRAHRFAELRGWPDPVEVALLRRYAAERGLVRVDH